MSDLATVYWLHLEEHFDITKDGYIGVSTRSPEERFREHLKFAKAGGKVTLSNAIRKYEGKIIVTTLLKGSLEYCFLLENKLRPTDRIGWNVIKGGGFTPTFSQPHTDESKAKIGEASRRNAYTPAKMAAYAKQVGVARSEETRLKMRKTIGKRLPWETSRANKEVWKLAGQVYDFFIENPMSFAKLEEHFKLPSNSLQNIYNKFKKQNWNPNDDALWLSWTTAI